MLFTTFLANDEVVAVSEYTRDEIVASAEQVDATAAPGSPNSAGAG